MKLVIYMYVIFVIMVVSVIISAVFFMSVQLIYNAMPKRLYWRPGPYWLEVDSWESVLLGLECRMSIRRKERKKRIQTYIELLII